MTPDADTYAYGGGADDSNLQRSSNESRGKSSNGDANVNRSSGSNSSSGTWSIAKMMGSMNQILAPVGAEVELKRKNTKTGKVENIEDQESAMKIADYSIKTQATQKAMVDLSYDERKEWVVGCKEEGNELFNQGKFSKAIEKYMQALAGITGGSNDEEKKDAIASMHVPLVNNLSACFFGLKEFKRAKALCDEALQLDKDNAKVLLRRGRAFVEIGELRSAISDFSRALELASSAHDPRMERAARKALTDAKDQKRVAQKKAKSMMQTSMGKLYSDRPDSVRATAEGDKIEPTPRPVPQSAHISSDESSVDSECDEEERNARETHAQWFVLPRVCCCKSRRRMRAKYE